MLKLIDDHVETIEHDGMFYTYCTLWDNPDNEEVVFPSERVGVGKTKNESHAKFMEHEKKRQELLTSLKAWQEELANC